MNQPVWTELAQGSLRLELAELSTLEINSPHNRNAMSARMWNGLREAVRTVAQTPQVRVLVLRGAGGRAFSAGADIGEFETVYATAESAAAYNHAVRAAQKELRELSLPTIAMIEGPCVGGGCGIALACDLRFASTEAGFAITPARLGLAYSYADTAQLVEKVGPARAKDILFSGRMLSAEEALRIGLIDMLHAPDTLHAATRDYAQTLAQRSSTSIATTKSMINQLCDLAAEGSSEMDALFARCFDSDDFKEGYRAFLDKRTPRFGPRTDKP